MEPNSDSVAASAGTTTAHGLYRSEFSSGHLIRLPADVLADNLEDALAKFYTSASNPARPLLIDFADARYIDIAALLNLTAVVVDRREHGWETYVGVPSSKSVRDFLRVWRYPDNFFEATGIPFERALPLDDLKYRGEPQTTYTGLGRDVDLLEYDRDWREGYPTRRNFFECCTYRLRAAHPAKHVALRPTSIPRLEGNRWNDPLIRAVLSKHLITGKELDGSIGTAESTSDSDDIARVAVYESLSNAVRHPHATVIQAISKFDHRGDVSSSSGGSDATIRGHLRICVWDDGVSIVDTLLPLIRQGRAVRALRLPEFMYDRIRVIVRDFEETKVDEFTISMANDPASDATEEQILLASLFPGISRAVAEIVDGVEPFDPDVTSPMSDAHGLGLFALTRTVLDSYQGVLFLRTGKFRLLLESAHDAYRKAHSVRYKAKLTRYPDDMPPFRGNLVVVHFPVRRFSSVTPEAASAVR